MIDIKWRSYQVVLFFAVTSITFFDAGEETNATLTTETKCLKQTQNPILQMLFIMSFKLLLKYRGFFTSRAKKTEWRDNSAESNLGVRDCETR